MCLLHNSYRVLGDLYCIKQSAYGDRINWLLYRGRVDFRDGKRLISGMVGGW